MASRSVTPTPPPQRRQQQRTGISSFHKPRLRLGDVSIYECGGHRQRSRSVSWNSTGQYLALASSDRLAKIWSFDLSGSNGGSGQGGGREVVALSGHAGPLERVRFHPTEPHLLCTAAQDRSVRLWDARSSRCFGRVELRCHERHGTEPASVEWHPGGGGKGSGGAWYIAVAEKDSVVRVYDARKLGGASSSSTPALRTFRLDPHVLQECHFSPSGTHLVAATRSGINGMGEIMAWQWDGASSNVGGRLPPDSMSFVGHTGPIYALRFSPNGTRLATGGSDALVGLWDVRSFVCTATVGRRTKFIRSVSFSHDSRLVASSTEEDGVDLADAITGESAGAVSIAPSNRRAGSGCGADEIAFHPKAYVLACARGEPVSTLGGSVGPSSASQAQVAVAKLSISVK